MIQGGYEYVSQSEFWNYYLNQSDASDLLRYDVSTESRKYLFNKYVTVCKSIQVIFPIKVTL